MAGGYKVTGALLFVKDQVGKLHQKYRGDVVPWLDDEQRQHFLGKGLVESLTAGGNDAAGGGDDAPAPASSARPAKVAPKEEWVSYGVTLGHAASDLEGLSKQELVDLLS